jgi:hypothetical protein
VSFIVLNISNSLLDQWGLLKLGATNSRNGTARYVNNLIVLLIHSWKLNKLVTYILAHHTLHNKRTATQTQDVSLNYTPPSVKGTVKIRIVLKFHFIFLTSAVVALVSTLSDSVISRESSQRLHTTPHSSGWVQTWLNAGFESCSSRFGWILMIYVQSIH